MPSFVIHDRDDAGATLGVLDAPNVYDAAVQAARRFYRSTLQPFRETGWPNHSGLFTVQVQAVNADERKGRTFYVRVP